MKNLTKPRLNNKAYRDDIACILTTVVYPASRKKKKQDLTNTNMNCIISWQQNDKGCNLAVCGAFVVEINLFATENKEPPYLLTSSVNSRTSNTKAMKQSRFLNPYCLEFYLINKHVRFITDFACIMHHLDYYVTAIVITANCNFLFPSDAASRRRERLKNVSGRSTQNDESYRQCWTREWDVSFVPGGDIRE